MTIQKKLNFNALPLFAHGRNLRQVSQHYWRQVRSGLIEEQGCRCEVCGATPKSETDTRNFHAHEEWEFDLEHQILILKHIGIICNLCHQTDHMGLLQQKYLKMQISEEEYEAVFKHYAKVNECSLNEAYADYKASCMAYRKDPNNYSQTLANAFWRYRLDCNFPAKDKMENALRKKGLLAE